MKVLRRILEPLRRTPLHPQWFCFRDEVSWLKRAASLGTGLVLDVGSGRQRIRPYLRQDCCYVALDYPSTATTLYRSMPDVYADGALLPLRPDTVDTALVLEVLEHIPAAHASIRDIARVLKPGGTLVVSVPFLYPLHDAPHDFHRWTTHGLRHLVEQHGFEVLTLAGEGTPPVTAALLLNLALSMSLVDLMQHRNPLALIAFPIIGICIPAINLSAWCLQRLSSDKHFMPFSLRLVARKPDSARSTVAPIRDATA